MNRALLPQGHLKGLIRKRLQLGLLLFEKDGIRHPFRRPVDRPAHNLPAPVKGILIGLVNILKGTARQDLLGTVGTPRSTLPFILGSANLAGSAEPLLHHHRQRLGAHTNNYGPFPKNPNMPSITLS